MTIIAKAEVQDGFVIPIPIECIPENVKGNEKIIVGVFDVPPSQKHLSDAYSFYGTENCERIIGKIPPGTEEKTIICVPAHCLLDQAKDLEGKPPAAHISPLWTEDRFGVSAGEAEMLGNTSQKMNRAIHLRMRKFRKDLNGLSIKTNKQAIKTIKNCELVIKKAQEELEKTKSECRWFTAECVAKFLRDKFKVIAWVDVLVEPAVLFCVNEKESDDQAVVIGCSIEGVMNEIEPDNADRFFDEYVYDASVFPIVMDVSFIDGKRVIDRKDYYQSSGGMS
jgi:hypothetical protein